MAMDHYGNTVDVGDTVRKVGYSDEYTVIDTEYGGEMLSLSGENWVENNVRVQDVMKIG